MATVFRRSISEPLRTGLTWHEVWKGEDGGLIQCWENGRRTGALNTEAVAAARAGELPPLDWKGGIAGQPKMKRKYGSLFYLATWQGMREQDLHIDVTTEVSVVCTRTGIKVIFTSDASKLEADSAEDGEKGLEES